jgi:prophage tail gpP-like protein
MKNTKKFFVLLLTAVLIFSMFSPNVVNAGSSVSVDLGGDGKLELITHMKIRLESGMHTFIIRGCLTTSLLMSCHLIVSFI